MVSCTRTFCTLMKISSTRWQFLSFNVQINSVAVLQLPILHLQIQSNYNTMTESNQRTPPVGAIEINPICSSGTTTPKILESHAEPVKKACEPKETKSESLFVNEDNPDEEWNALDDSEKCFKVEDKNTALKGSERSRNMANQKLETVTSIEENEGLSAGARIMQMLAVSAPGQSQKKTILPADLLRSVTDEVRELHSCCSISKADGTNTSMPIEEESESFKAMMAEDSSVVYACSVPNIFTASSCNETVTLELSREIEEMDDFASADKGINNSDVLLDKLSDNRVDTSVAESNSNQNAFVRVSCSGKPEEVNLVNKEPEEFIEGFTEIETKTGEKETDINEVEPLELLQIDICEENSKELGSDSKGNVSERNIEDVNEPCPQDTTMDCFETDLLHIDISDEPLVEAVLEGGEVENRKKKTKKEKWKKKWKKKHGQKNEGDADDENEGEKNEQRKSKPLPNYFIAIQINDEKIRTSLEEVQREIVEGNGKLKEAIIRPSTFHITLMVLSLNTPEEIQRSVAALDDSSLKLIPLYKSSPLTLGIAGIGNFRNEVVFAKVKNEEEIERLRNISEIVEDCHLSKELVSPDSKGFKPHLTIAKMSKVKGLKKKGLKKIDECFYSSHLEREFGTQAVSTLQLCSMHKHKDKLGYYFVEHSVDFSV